MSRTDTPVESATTTSGSPEVVVRVHDLHVAWDASLVLHGLTTSILAGATVALTGANGSGKSTLMRALLGNAPVTSGSIELFGTDITRGRRVPWDRIGYVPQRVTSAGSIAASALEVVRSGLLGPHRLTARRGDRARALEALERVGLAHRAKAPFAILSGGQQQRVLIARALVRHPDLLLMDEPLAGIDANSRRRLAEVVGGLKAEGTTILVVLHELAELGPLLDRELHLANGHITRDGRPCEVPGADAHGHDHHVLPEQPAFPGTPGIQQILGGQ